MTPKTPRTGGDPIASESSRPSFVGCLADMASDLRTVAGVSPWNVPVTVLFRLQFQLLASYRVARWIASTRRWHKVVTVPIRYWQHVVAGCQVSPFARLGRGVRFPHPLGIVIGEHVVIEDDVVVFQQVTLGSHGRKDAPAAYPVVQSGAVLYAGAKVIGGVTIGRGAIVGANAVVLDDVPPGASAVGVPARSHTSRSAIEHQP